MCRRNRSAVVLVAVLLLVVEGVHGQESALKRVTRDLPEPTSTYKTLISPEQRGIVESPMARTFGHKRIQFMMMPMIYKMGVMMTMIAVLTVISLKGLIIGVTLLVLKLSTIFGKLFSNSHEHSSSWGPQHQPIHLHLHNAGPYESHGQPYGPWEPAPPSPHESYYYKG